MTTVTVVSEAATHAAHAATHASSLEEHFEDIVGVHSLSAESAATVL